MKKQFESYEEVARHLLERFRAYLCLDSVEGKQMIGGQSGTNWEIDAKGIRTGARGDIVILEFRRKTTRRVEQEDVAGLAWRLQDTGASGGILVSPLGFQKGARLVATAAGIVEATLAAESTTSDYMLGFVNRIFRGVTDYITLQDASTWTLRDETGNIIGEGQAEVT